MHNIWKEFLPVMLKLESCLLPFANFLANFAFAEFWPTVFLAATIHIWRKEECWYFLSDWLWPTYAIQDNLGPPTTATHHSLHYERQTDSSNYTRDHWLWVPVTVQSISNNHPFKKFQINSEPLCIWFWGVKTIILK